MKMRGRVVLVVIVGLAMAMSPLEAVAAPDRVELSKSALWVELNPTRPDRIMDGRLAGTELGRVLLDTDMIRKRATAELMRPQSPTGRRLWSELRSDHGMPCLTYRNSIEPAHDNLSVKIVPVGCAQSPETAEHNQRVLDTVIQPVIEHEVNTAPQYANLRRAYHDLAAGRASTTTTSARPWYPREVASEYFKSYQDSEFPVVILGGIDFTRAQQVSGRS